MADQFLTFRVGSAQYAVSVFRVRSVLTYREPQSLPCPDPLVAGIIRWQDKNVPVVRLREKFGLESKAADSETRLVVFEAYRNATSVLFSAIVDSVQEVAEIEMTDEPPPVGNSIASRFISGVGIRDDNYIIILNSDSIFSPSELETISGAASEQRQGDL